MLPRNGATRLAIAQRISSPRYDRSILALVSSCAILALLLGLFTPLPEPNTPRASLAWLDLDPSQGGDGQERSGRGRWTWVTTSRARQKKQQPSLNPLGRRRNPILGQPLRERRGGSAARSWVRLLGSGVAAAQPDIRQDPRERQGRAAEQSYLPWGGLLAGRQGISGGAERSPSH